MIIDCDAQQVELICVIVNFGLSSKVVKIAKKVGISGATICIGKGTVSSRILEFLALSETRKEIVIMLAGQSIADQALEALNSKMSFDKPNHGIAFRTDVKRVLGCRGYQKEKMPERRLETMYNLIVAIVDKSKAEDVIETASKAGSRGGTIINARGSGIHETSKLFSMDIEPEKEIVLILTDSNLTDDITAAINNKLEMEKPGNGIIFVQDINKTYGLY